MTGFQTSRPRFSSWSRWVSHISAMVGGAVRKFLMSAPVEKARSPAPVMIAHPDLRVVAHGARRATGPA
jgi:hypothetical protein